jgi:hypothetical protein
MVDLTRQPAPPPRGASPQDAIVTLLAAVGFVLASTVVVAAG